MIKSERFEIRCDPVWYRKIKQRAAENQMSVAIYIRTIIALGESLIDGDVFKHGNWFRERPLNEIAEEMGLYGDTSALIPGKEEKWTEQHSQT